jgi:hypothetical protein
MLSTVPITETSSPILPSSNSSTKGVDNADMVLRLGSPHPYWASAKVLQRCAHVTPLHMMLSDTLLL